MFGEVMLIEASGTARKANRLPLGNTAGRDESWLRDTLFAHPEILPMADLESSFGPLIPLCTELRTSAGPVDIAFINSHGKLTLVECKLWRNPEARRKVVAQILDYARSISKWNYADLQRQVSAATGRKGNIPFEVVRQNSPGLQEHLFADAVTKALQSGRFMLIIAGDGIREDISGIASLITGNAASAFNVGLVEVALYDIGNGGLAIQPRVIARTQVIERFVVIAENGQLADRDLQISEDDKIDAKMSNGVNPRQQEYRTWWKPVVETPFDDPEQSPPIIWQGFIRATLPYPGMWVTAYRDKQKKTIGVFLGGRKDSRPQFWRTLNETGLDVDILSQLPAGTTVSDNDGTGPIPIATRQMSDFTNDDEQRFWLAETLNVFVNVFREALRQVSATP